MRKPFALATAALVALVAPGAAANIELSGYIDVGWYDLEGAGTGAVAGNLEQRSPALTAVGSTNGAQTTAGQQTSAVNEVNIDLTAELADNVTVFASFDAIPTGGRGADATRAGGAGDGVLTGSGSNGGTLTLDMAYIDFQNPGAMPINVRAGAIPSVLGIEQREAESNQKRTISLSLLSPYTVGSVVGTGVYGSFDFINYQLSWTNTDPFGPGASLATSAAIAAIPVGAAAPRTDIATGAGSTLNAPNNNGITGVDADNNRTISGRLGFTPLEGLEIGVSGSIGKYAAPLATGDQERRLVAADLSYIWGPWSAKAEYINFDEDNSINAGADDGQFSGFYVEGAYEFGSVASMAKSGGLVVRYSEITTEVDGNSLPGGQGQSNFDDVSQVALGGWLDLSNDVRMKIEYQLNSEDTLGGNPIDSDNDVLAMSVVASF